MKNSRSGSSGAQFLWASLIVLVALWVIAFAAHIGGGVITYLVIVSLAALLIRSAIARAKATTPAHQEAKGRSPE
ncbi:MAG TPA: hypothetical protein VKT29_17600 [Terriglobales bacterium]|nr:hypothetical protein [Terriglobales bacterium]